MSRASNSLKTSDVLATPIKLKYTASYTSASAEEVGIRVLRGINGSITTTGSVSNETLLYRSIRHLYYSNYLTGSYQVSASYADNWLQSTAASGTLEADIRYFPTASNAAIKVMSIPRELFGEKVARESFNLLSGVYDIEDDGNGNLVDTGNVHVGNLLYAQGLAVITNQSYQTIETQPYTMSFTAETTIYQNEVKCRVNENDFNYSQNPTIVTRVASAPSGTLADNVTGSDFRPYATTVGLFNAMNELLVVGKLATPYPIPSNTDMTFVIRWDS